MISHDAYRTGAPILLLNLTDVLLRNDYKVDFILKIGGPLEADFRKRGATFLAHRNPNTIKEKIQNKINRFPYYEVGSIDFSRYDVIISNTITNGDLLTQIRKFFSGPIISYIHELKMATHTFTTPKLVESLIKSTNTFAVPSEAVEKYLINNLSINPAAIKSLNYYIPDRSLVQSGSKHNRKGFTVGALGTTDWRKSPDLFIQTAIILFREFSDESITFIWQGASPNDIALKRLNYDIEKAGMEGRIKITEATSNVESFYNSIDLLFLTSREDPFPLVVLEAANFNIPTVCFNGTGGACEFITSCKGGTVIPYLELSKAAKAIWWYRCNPEDLKQAGRNAKMHLTSFYQDESVILRQFESIINGKT